MAKGNKYQKIIMDVLGTRPISFNPDLSVALGSVTASLFLCQLLYWWKKGRYEDMIWKTVEEMKEETSLSKAQQLHAQRLCVRKGVLKVLYKSIPPKRHFQIKIDNIISLLQQVDLGKERSFKRRKTRHMDISKDEIYMSDTGSYITESTFQENTKENTNKEKRVATRRGDGDVTRLLNDFNKNFGNIPSTSKRL